MKLPESVSVDAHEEQPRPTVPETVSDSRPGSHDPDSVPIRPKRVRRSAVFTSTPDTPAPYLLCPICDLPLAYRQTVLSGVKPVERWDYLDCRTCGAFVYRDRTRKLRPAI